MKKEEQYIIKTIYALIDENSQETKGGESIVLDGIEKRSFQTSPRKLLERDWDPATWLLMVKDPRLIGINLEVDDDSQGNWYEVDFIVEPSEHANAELYFLKANEETIPSPVRIISAKKINNQKIIQKLRSFSRLSGSPRTSKNQVQILIDNAMIGIQKRMLVVYDVGQANWHALVDVDNCPNTPPPVHLFFDFGVPTGWNYSTQPSPPIDPLGSKYVNQEAPVILSHWDMDHWAGAALGQPLYGSRGLVINWDPRAVASRTWLVPNQGRFQSGQKITPTAWRLALALHRHRNLLIWPSLMTRVQSISGDWVVKCTPSGTVPRNNNNTGLALFIAQHDSEFSSDYILAPSDAEYVSVYAHMTAISRINHLVASHHGGALKVPTAIPIASSGCSKLAFSHGAKYGHPAPSAINSHYGHRWRSQFETINRSPRPAGAVGSIGLGGGISCAHISLCQNCTAAIHTCPSS
ncbi:hypothetical protein N5D77_25255 [Comamonas thiooxydans]|uniref:Uncharacterized protein n=1 Tax=Comamonas thiooxydans TaxID=363952 RepID=A0AA42Q2P1_9BURK|nr:hypothetical protein [Comamonas thiooxydans]MDH1336148.1 hypothetical protein [Comamonas thiooxydans]MDH1741971.1 hypothetical protein [Comamonas thiooxydans]MDH1789874.1 hypothetical protein [Comamonas thiooxydans]